MQQLEEALLDAWEKVCIQHDFTKVLCVFNLFPLFPTFCSKFPAQLKVLLLHSNTLIRVFALEATAASIQREMKEQRAKITPRMKALGSWTRVRRRKEVTLLLTNVKKAKPQYRAASAEIFLTASKVQDATCANYVPAIVSQNHACSLDNN